MITHKIKENLSKRKKTDILKLFFKKTSAVFKMSAMLLQLFWKKTCFLLNYKPYQSKTNFLFVCVYKNVHPTNQ